MKKSIWEDHQIPLRKRGAARNEERFSDVSRNLGNLLTSFVVDGIAQGLKIQANLAGIDATVWSTQNEHRVEIKAACERSVILRRSRENLVLRVRTRPPGEISPASEGHNFCAPL